MSDKYCQNCNLRSDDLFNQVASNYRKNCNKIEAGDILVCKYCKEQFEISGLILKAIIDSDSIFKLVIGGPGTGKTFLFKNIIENLPAASDVLVITFINNLVEDLNKQLGQIIKTKVTVRTLHSFCKGFLLSHVHPYKYFPELPKIVEKDATFLGFNLNKEKLSHEIANIERDGSHLRFYLSRAEYYDAVSHEDAAYRVYLYLKDNAGNVPKYTSIIIDEYQDFNSLEANIIRILTQANPSIIAGDDDQALYRFKSASPEFIRDLHKDDKSEKHNLIYCRRCTAVMVKAANDIIEFAIREKKLINRIPKNFKCYWPDKYNDSRDYPKIILAKCSTHVVAAKYIKKRILEIVDKDKIQPSDKKEPEFLIVGPSRIPHYLKDVNSVLLNEDGIDPNVYEIEYKKEKEVFDIEEGYKLIKEDNQSNLGWRIVLYCDHLEADKEKDIVLESLSGKKIIELLSSDYISKHLKNVESISLENEQKAEEEKKKIIKIKLTSYLLAKGLSANHVFVLGLENGIMPENPYNISDDEVCQFIVLLTRARRSLSVLSCKTFNKKYQIKMDNLSIFISMIPGKLIDVYSIKAADVKRARKKK